MTLRVSAAAEADLEDAVLYIAADNPDAAQRWLAEMWRRFEQLTAFPGTGVARYEVRPGLRLLPAGRYLILYSSADDGTVEIIRVLHSTRQWEDLL